VTLILVVIVAVTLRAASAIAPVAPAALGESVLIMELPDDPTIISMVGETLVEDAVTASSALFKLRAVPAMVLLVGLRREDKSLLALVVLYLGIWERRLQ
jgi:hypothetical protein